MNINVYKRVTKILFFRRLFISSQVKVASRSHEDKVDKAVPAVSSAPRRKVIYGMEV